MNNKIIEFLYPKESKSLLEDVFPIPTKNNLPDWFKKLKTDFEKKTIKSCVPFLETLTSGYILKMPQDFYIKHNFLNKENKLDSIFRCSYHDFDYAYLLDKGLNLNTSHPQIHSPLQLGEECPYHQKNKNLRFYKILNPFIIKTPPGYSCLFTSPLNNNDDRFEIISGIVNTDTFPSNINFPIIINGYKYPNLETTIKRGTPYVQIIPFKRDNWKLNMVENKTSNFLENRLKILKHLWNTYRNCYWNKTKWN